MPGLESLTFTEPVEMDEEFDSHINFKIKLKSIISTDSAHLVLPNAEGIYKLSRHPINRDLTCRLDIQVIQVGELFYFNHKRLFLGDSIQFGTKNFLYNGIVLGQ